jgi:hypothetical protein
MTANQYDEVIRQLEAAGAGDPPGRLYHACSAPGPNLRVVDVWETAEEFEAFAHILMPILHACSVDPGEPDVSPVYNIIPGRSGASVRTDSMYAGI